MPLRERVRFTAGGDAFYVLRPDCYKRDDVARFTIRSAVVLNQLGYVSIALDLLKNSSLTPDQIEAIQKLIKDHFHVDVSVKCIVTNAKGKIPPNIAQDGMVATAIQHGGEIVDMDE